MTPRIREEASSETLRTRTEAIQTQSKGKAKLEDEESSDEAPKDVDWKLVHIVQRYRKEQEENYGLDNASAPVRGNPCRDLSYKIQTV